jgi:type VI secretion system secreted protein Hcp
MNIPGFASITGENQGLIEGSCDLENLVGKIEMYSYNHLVEIPRDPQSGLPIGRRVHRTLTFTKEIDKSTPKLYQALCTGETLSEVEFSWYRYVEGGGHDIYFTLKLENALITAIRPEIRSQVNMNQSDSLHLEDVSITYERIIWTWVPDGIEFEDAWVEPGGEN